jgi:hypothetical protein
MYIAKTRIDITVRRKYRYCIKFTIYRKRFILLSDLEALKSSEVPVFSIYGEAVCVGGPACTAPWSLEVLPAHRLTRHALALTLPSHAHCFARCREATAFTCRSVRL